MVRALFLFALIITAAWAFVPPTSNSCEFSKSGSGEDWLVVATRRQYCLLGGFQFFLIVVFKLHRLISDVQVLIEYFTFHLTQLKLTTDFSFPSYFPVSSPAFSRVEAPKMSAFDNFADVATSSIAQSSELLASQAGDFGGYLFPVVGLAALGAVILVLAPPLADE